MRGILRDTRRKKIFCIAELGRLVLDVVGHEIDEETPIMGRGIL